MKMKLTFEKKGKTVNVNLKNNSCFLSIDNVTSYAEPTKIKGVWAYRVIDKKITENLLGKGKGDTVYIAHPSAEQVYNEIERRKETERKKKEMAIKTGEIPIKLRFYDGEYLSGYSVASPELAADLLTRLDLAEYVSGWGVLVKDELVDALGTKFTYPQAAKFAKPIREEKDRKRREREAAKAAKFAQAKETGEPVILYRWTEPCNDPDEECSIDTLIEYAMPDGSTKVERHHTW